jgi:hypothetical protein
MLDLSAVVTLLSAWFVVSIPVSFVAGYLIGSQERRYLQSRIVVPLAR